MSDVKLTDPKTWWFLENAEGRWLENDAHGTFTSDPDAALKWPNATAADAFRLGLRGPLWSLKITEHMWVETYDWSDLEDDLADVISDSMDMDWTSRIGARAVVEYLKKVGARIP